MNEYEMYKSGMSIPEVSGVSGIALSTLRFRFKKQGILRSRAEAVRLSAEQGKLGSGGRGKKRVFTDEWKSNISKSKKGKGKGFSIKPNGYVEVTMGGNKGRLEHVVIMEAHIKRRLYSNECVHHKNMIKTDNRLENLELMTRANHARLHAMLQTRARDGKGRYL